MLNETIKRNIPVEEAGAKKFLSPLKLQLFAEGGDGGKGGAGDDGEQGGSGSGEEGNGKEEKTYTQAELNAIAKKEKESGRKAILKELGIEDAKSAKDGLEKFKQWQDEQKTAEEKAKDDAAKAEKAKADAEAKALLAESKLNAIKAGVIPAYVDDVVALAMIKVSDEKDFDAVLTDMKETYPNFFNVEEEEDKNKSKKNSGTGTAAKTSSGGKQEVASIGERLAKRNAVTKKESSYFKNR